MIGTGWAWLASNIIYFLLWTPVVHRRFAHGLHWGWILQDIARPSLPALIVAAAAMWWVTWSQNRTWLAIELAAAGVVFMVLTYLPADRLTLPHRLTMPRRAKRDVA